MLKPAVWSEVLLHVPVLGGHIKTTTETAKAWADGFNSAIRVLEGPPAESPERALHIEKALAWHHQQLHALQAELGTRAPDSAREQVLRIHREQGLNAAIKAYRTAIGCGLRESHDAVVAIIRGLK